MPAVMLVLTMLLSASPDASFLRDFAETRRFLAGRPVGATFTPDGKSVVFLRSSSRDARQQLFELDVGSGQTRELLTSEQVLAGAAERLSVEEKARLERMRVSARGFTSFKLSPDGKQVLVGLSGKLYVFDRQTSKALQLKTGEGACIDAKFSPDGTRVAYVRGHDVFQVELKTNTERAITTGGTALKPHGAAEFVAQEEMSRFAGFWFSPDGAQVAFQETDHTGLERFGIADPLHPEAETERFFYPRPGKANATVRLGITKSAGGAVTWVSWDSTKYPYLATVRWQKGAALTLVVQSRDQRDEAVLRVDPKTGKTQVLLVEHDEAWLNLAQEFPHWLPDGKAFLWMTERNGTPDIELRRADGSLDEVWVRDVHGYDGHTKYMAGVDDAGTALYVFRGETPMESALYRVEKGGVPVRVTTGLPSPALETAVQVGPAGFLVTTTSGKTMPQTVVVGRDGQIAATVPSVAETPKLTLDMQVMQLESGIKSYAAVFRPAGFKAGTKYPVVLQVYGGPGHLEVVHSMRENLVLQWLANRGFIVVKLDGRGTPRRGRAFERAIRGDFATLIAQDQLDGLAALGKRVPEMDMKRVGVYGWSFGGYLSALLAMKHGDAIKSAVSGAPVVDWLDYDTHYTERFLGVPPDATAAYDVSSLLTYAPLARRPVLLIHGTADDNVYFLHSLKLSDALFKAGAPHSVLPLSNFTHMVPDPVVTQRLWERIATFFAETL
jgi:dipeptidyl-peptidase 4